MKHQENLREQTEELGRVLQALGDPIRLQIVRQLLEQGQIACGAFAINMPKSSLSHHFRVLREARVIGTHKEGTSLMNYVLHDQLEARHPGLLAAVFSSEIRQRNLSPRKP